MSACVSFAQKEIMNRWHANSHRTVSMFRSIYNLLEIIFEYALASGEGEGSYRNSYKNKTIIHKQNTIIVL